MMYKCDCGHYFDEPEIRQEYRGEFWGMPAYESWARCPRCGSDYFDEVVEEEERGGDGIMWIAEKSGSSTIISFYTQEEALRHAEREGGKWYVYKIEMEGMR